MENPQFLDENILFWMKIPDFHMKNPWFLNKNLLFLDGKSAVFGWKICSFCTDNPQFSDGKSAVFGQKIQFLDEKSAVFRPNGLERSQFGPQC